MSPIVSVSHVISYSPIGSIMSRSVSCCLIISQDVYDCDELVPVRQCSCVHMMEVQEVQKGDSSLFQSWTPHTEMLFVFHLPCVA